MLSETRFFKQGRIVSGMMALALALLVSLPSTASAAFSSCRSDPIVYLSDGTVLVITVDIATSVTNVETVSYVVHGPKGVTLANVIHTPFPGFTGKEKFDYKDDAQLGQYVTDTTAVTRGKGTKVIATSVLGSQTKVIPGVSKQLLRAIHTR
ncbi:MAG: hypothetical protein HZB51_09780 [Chloroflexi bacterium]|nr:hypothetical protein [Chloroflexota bacterium]